MDFPIRAFAKMARASGFSREEAEEKLKGKAPEKETMEALDAAYVQDAENLKNQLLSTLPKE